MGCRIRPREELKHLSFLKSSYLCLRDYAAVLDHDPSLPNEEIPVRVVGGDEHRDPPPLALRDDVIHHPSSTGVETRVGLVEKQQIDVTEQCQGEGTPTPLAGGKPTVGGLAQRLQPQERHHLIDAFRRHPGHAGVEDKIRPDPEIFVQKRVRTHVGESTTMLASVEPQVGTEDHRPPGSNREKTGNESKQAGLAGPVRTCHDHHLAALHHQIHPGKDGEAVERRHDPVEDDHRVRAGTKG